MEEWRRRHLQDMKKRVKMNADKIKEKNEKIEWEYK